MLRLYPVLRTVVVNLKSGTVFRGVVWRKRFGYLILRNAEMIHGKGERIPVDGEVLIERANVDFIQVMQAVN